jgi:hypothetical protein
MYDEAAAQQYVIQLTQTTHARVPASTFSLVLLLGQAVSHAWCFLAFAVQRSGSVLLQHDATCCHLRCVSFFCQADVLDTHASLQCVARCMLAAKVPVQGVRGVRGALTVCVVFSSSVADSDAACVSVSCHGAP